MRPKRGAASAVVLSCVLIAGGARAQAENVGEARTYFNAGAQAYEAGQFPAAIQAFERAYQLAPREAIIFTIGQAHRRQYYIDKNPAHLKAAIERYRDYLKRVPEGGRRADAAEALAELEPIAARVDSAVGDTEPGAAVQPAARQTRVMVTSPTPNARVSLNGATPASLPLIAEVAKGKHRVKVAAPGFFDEERELQAAEGGILALDITLREQPGKLDIAVEEDAEITVDGRLVGLTPLSRPIELPAGRHLVAVLKNGRTGFTKEVRIERGKSQRLDVKLESTGQRLAANVLFVSSAGALLTGGVFTVLAIRQEGDAKDIRDEAGEANIDREQLVAYNDALDRRDDYRRAAFLSFGASAALGATGFLLYSFDQPSLRDVRGLELTPEPVNDQAPEQRTEPTMELGAAPVWSPEMAGAAVVGRF